jgi:glycosyltransferase involved in cell wall biosynthesis
LARTFDIITTCKGRLEHLKRSLPRMLDQGAANVIVVDYSCPDGTGDYVREHFPSARVVPVEGQPNFSNWRARNAGASVASSQVLVFCDADTILARNGLEWVSEHLPERALGHFEPGTRRKFNKARLSLADNQLAGFLVVPRAAFMRIRGYDEVLEGYGAGGDTDLTYRLGIIGLKFFPLDAKIIDEVLEHGDADRARFHADSMADSYCAGLIYRSAKRYLMAIRNRFDLDVELRQRLYESARNAATKLDRANGTAGITLTVEQSPVQMSPLLGYERGTQKISLRVELAFEQEGAQAGGDLRQEPAKP